jgi:hypothetical protein
MVINQLLKMSALTYNKKTGRWMFGTKYVWTSEMVFILERYYPDTVNDEISGMLGVCKKCLIKKAHQLGLHKSKRFYQKNNWYNVHLARKKASENAPMVSKKRKETCIRMWAQRKADPEWKDIYLKGWNTRRERYGMTGRREVEKSPANSH